MPMPSDVPIVDLMLSLPILDPGATYANLRAAAKDEESRKEFSFPAQYMFKGVPHEWGRGRDPIEVTIEEMDKWNVECALIGVHTEDTRRAVRERPDRFIPSFHFDPNQGMEAVREIVRLHTELGLKAVSTFPAGTQV